MKILLLGKNGQVGWELQRALAPLGEVVALDRQGAEGLCGDLSDLAGLARTVQAVQPHRALRAAAGARWRSTQAAQGRHRAATVAPGEGAAATAASHYARWNPRHSVVVRVLGIVLRTSGELRRPA